MAESGSLCLSCEPTLVVSRAACGPARGTDKILTDSIDAHVEAERRRDDDDGQAAGRLQSQ